MSHQSYTDRFQREREAGRIRSGIRHRRYLDPADAERRADALAPRGPYGAHAPAPSEPRTPGYTPPAPVEPWIAEPIVGSGVYSDGERSPELDAERVARIVDRSPVRPVSESLERQVLDLCRRPGPYRIEALAVANAPESLPDLQRAMRGGTALGFSWGALRDAVGMHSGIRVPVSIEHSEATIWSAPEVNAMARAWHDSVHLSLGTAFDLEGELATARAQCAKIVGRPERRLLWIEIAGQSLCHDALGRFPRDQRGFVLRAWGAVQDGASMDDAIASAIDRERKGGE